MELYIDGILNNSQADTTTGSLVNTGNVLIGNPPYIGLIDEVYIFSRALSADEIRAHYLRGIQSFGTILADKFRIIDTNNDINFYVGSDGNVGIGTTTPEQILTVNDTSNTSGRVGYFRRAIDNINEYAYIDVGHDTLKLSMGTLLENIDVGYLTFGNSVDPNNGIGIYLTSALEQSVN